MRYKYTRFVGDDLEGIDLEALIAKLSDLLLSSGFEHPHQAGSPSDEEHSLQALHDAIIDALLNGDLLSDDVIERLLGDPADADQADGRSRLEELIQQLIEQMARQGYITQHPDLNAERRQREAGGTGELVGGGAPPVRFEITDKGLDFLGYRALRDLFGSLGKSSIGHHDTRELATGVEVSGSSKPYEFGDTLNLDASGTIRPSMWTTRT